jgi:hypothetical protein
MAAGATEPDLARKLEHGNEDARRRAVDEISRAAEYWKIYTGTAAKAY